MSELDIAALVQPISDDKPCGDDCEYDAVFQALELAAAGQPERQMGDSVQAAVPPDWKAVKTHCLTLFTRAEEPTRDLRVAIYLASALLHTDGWAGLADGLRLVAELCDKHWQHLHPQLDPDDQDPTLRCNALAPLTYAELLPGQLREFPLVMSRAAGVYSRCE